MAVINITSKNYEEEILKSDKPVLLDFWAVWCGPCKMVSPLVDEIALENTDIKVGKINIDDQFDLARSFGVMSIPTLIVMKDGKEVTRSVGAMPKDDILKLIK